MKKINYNKIVLTSQDIIRNIDGLTGSDAFEEIIKIIFTLNLYSKENLNADNLRIRFSNDIFPKYDFFIGYEIKLKDITIDQIINLFSEVDFESEDVRGKLFETYLGRVFTSGLGQFFTPREIVDFIIGYLQKKQLIPHNANILDPACGSGGILLKSIDSNTNKVFGFDINERLVRVSKMNMVLHGIENYEINNQSFLLHEDKEVYDLCVTNPPFGVQEKQSDILKSFIFGHDKKSCDLEILFVEKIIKVLKPGGICGIVLPDGIFNNVTATKLREFILLHTDIIATVDLPENVFKSSGTGCETGILFFRKKINKSNCDASFDAYKINYVGYETQTKFAKKINENDKKEKESNKRIEEIIKKMKESVKRNIEIHQKAKQKENSKKVKESNK
jgi:type I restriction enzyme M protein